MARFEVVSTPEGAQEGARGGDRIELDARENTFGREAGNTFVLADPRASRRHARVAHTPEGWLLEDLQSGNGTWVNGERTDRHLLKTGDVVRLGLTELRFDAGPEIGADPAPPEPLSGPPARQKRKLSKPADTPPLSKAAGNSGPSPTVPAPDVPAITVQSPAPVEPATSIPPSPHPPQPALRPERRRRGRLAAGTSAGLLVLTGLVVVAGLGTGLYATRGGTNLRLLPAIVSSVMRNGWSGRLNPQAPKPSGAPALDLKPFSGVRIRAPKNAMDKARTVRVSPVGAAWGSAIKKAARARKEIPVAAFRVDAGMTGREQFPGEMSVSVDLSKRGVPKELWPYARFYHVDDRGEAHLMDTGRRGSTVSCKARHNSIFAVLIGLGYGCSVAVYTSAEAKFAGESAWNTFSSENFKVYWPASLPPRNPAVFNAVNDELESIWKRYLAQCVELEGAGGMDPAGPPNPMLTAYVLYRADPRVQALAPKMADPKWMLENYVPVEVGNSLAILERCYTYLTGGRGDGNNFNQPTFKVDILFRSTWPHGAEDLALTISSYILYPYIDMRLDKVPKVPLDPSTANPAFDDLYCTCLHELFHALQKTYYGPESHDYTWFQEATAVALEPEAFQYFQANRWVLANRGTDRSHLYGVYFDPMQFAPAASWDSQRHGYGESYFVEFLRNRYYAKAWLQFLPRLMKDFGTSGGGTIASLANVTSGSGEQLGQDFLTFCSAQAGYLLQAHVADNPAGGTVSLNWDSPSCTWAMDTPRPLSCRFLRVGLPSPPPADPSQPRPVPVLVVRGNANNDDGVILRASPNGSDWKRVVGGDLMVGVAPDRKGRSEAWLQRIETYLSPPGKFATQYSPAHLGTSSVAYNSSPGALPKTVLFALLSGPKPVETKQVQDRIGISWRASPLGGQGLLKGYDVAVTAQGRKPFEETTAKPGYWIDMKKVFGKDLPKPGEKVRVVYRLRAKTAPETTGPWSEPLDVEVADDPFTGIWQGTMTITGEKVGDMAEKFIVGIFGEGARSAVKRNVVIGSSNGISLSVAPKPKGAGEYNIVYRNGARPNWAEWQAKGEGAVDGDALVFELEHPDGSVVTFRLVSPSKDRLSGTFSARGFLIKDALTGTVAVARTSPPKK